MITLTTLFVIAPALLSQPVNFKETSLASLSYSYDLRSDENCKILGTIPPAEEKEIAADANYSYKQYAEYFGGVPAAITLDLRKSKSKPDGDTPYLPWISAEEVKEQLKGQVPDTYMDQVLEQLKTARPLSHEIGHVLLIDYVEAKTKGKTGLATYGNYGSPYLQDWADEAFAVICEQGSLHGSRLDQAKDLSKAVPLKKLFTMTHPQDIKRVDTGGEKIGVKIATGGEAEMAHEKEVAAFYAEVASVCEFMKEKAGSKYFKLIIDGLIAQKTMDQILPTIDGLPSSVDQLDKDWRAWVAK